MRRYFVPAIDDARITTPAKIENAARNWITYVIWITTARTVSIACATLITVTVGYAAYSARCNSPTRSGVTCTPPDHTTGSPSSAAFGSVNCARPKRCRPSSLVNATTVAAICWSSTANVIVDPSFTPSQSASCCEIASSGPRSPAFHHSPETTFVPTGTDSAQVRLTERGIRRRRTFLGVPCACSCALSSSAFALASAAVTPSIASTRAPTIGTSSGWVVTPGCAFSTL